MILHQLKWTLSCLGIVVTIFCLIIVSGGLQASSVALCIWFSKFWLTTASVSVHVWGRNKLVLVTPNVYYLPLHLRKVLRRESPRGRTASCGAFGGLAHQCLPTMQICSAGWHPGWVGSPGLRSTPTEVTWASPSVITNQSLPSSLCMWGLIQYNTGSHFSWPYQACAWIIKTMVPVLYRVKTMADKHWSFIVTKL